MARVPLLLKLAGKYAGRVDFAFVYITEAHAKDEWPIGSVYSSNNQPVTLEERLALAGKLLGKYKIPTFVDTMDNGFEAQYASWPLRFFMLKAGKVQWVSEPNPEHFGQPSDAELERRIEEHLAAH